jgi:hypothetical protein
VALCVENPHSETACFINKESAVLSVDSIPVDASKTYKISAWFKSAGAAMANVFLGFQPLDAMQVPIELVHVNVVPDTETELAEACAPQDTVIRIKDRSNWKAYNLNSVAFDVDDTGSLKDLPNRNISSGVVRNIENKDSFFNVTLSEPCGMSYPSGTKVRLHCRGDTYKYMNFRKQWNSPEWEEFTARVEANDFYQGTKFIKIAIVVLDAGKVCFFDDIKFAEVK